MRLEKLSTVVFHLCFLSGIVLVKGQELCNFNVTCGILSREYCEQRNCCYAPSPYRLYNCVQKFQVAHSAGLYNGPRNKINQGEEKPADAISLPPDIDQYADMLKLEESEQITSHQAIQTVESLEDYLQDVATEANINWSLSKEKVYEAKVVVEEDSFYEVVEFESGTKIQIDPSSNTEQNDLAAILFVEYFTLGNFLRNVSSESTESNPNSSNCTPQQRIIDNATVISVTGLNSKGEEVPIALKFSLNHLDLTTTRKSNGSLSCEFLDESSMRWSAHGCYVIGAGRDSVTCGCNHTTKFSVLFLIQPLEYEVSPHHANNIKIVEFVMEGLSLFCLVLTFVSLIFALRRRSKSSTIASSRAKERTVVHLHFIAALSALHLARLSSEAAYGVDSLCTITVIFSHYFMLSSGVWMLIEGIVLYVNVIVKSMKHIQLGRSKFLAGWGIPAAIVIVSAGIGIHNGTYIQRVKRETHCGGGDEAVVVKEPITSVSAYEYCWLSVDSNMIWSAMGPLLAIFTINFFILAHIVGFVLRLSLKSDSLKPSGHKTQSGQHVWNTTKGILVLFPILGIPWLIGFLVNISNHEASLTFQYVHITLNGLQGVFIFILYCAANKEVRDLLRRVLNNRWQQHKISRSQSLKNSTAKEKYKRSISSIMGLQCNSIPIERRHSRYQQRLGSQVSQQSFFTQQRLSSASVSTNSTVYRKKRKYSTASLDFTRQTGGLGYITSFPQRSGIRNAPKMTRSPSTRSLTVETSPNNSMSRACKLCATSHKTCFHELMPGLNLEPGEPILTSYECSDSVNSDLPLFNTRWQRMSAEEFKRFSAIPEEKRRSGINSCTVESNDAINNVSRMWDSKAKTLEQINISETCDNMHSVTVDIHNTHNNNSDNNSENDISASQSWRDDQPEENFYSEMCTTKAAKSSLSLPNCSNKLQSKNMNQSNCELEIFVQKPSTSLKKGGKSVPTSGKVVKGDRLSTYSDQLLKAVEKWRFEAAQLGQMRPQQCETTF